MKILNWISSGFVYRSPKPNEGFARFLETLPSRKLRALADTTTHYSKKKLVQIYLQKNALTKIPIKQSSQ